MSLPAAQTVTDVSGDFAHCQNTPPLARCQKGCLDHSLPGRPALWTLQVFVYDKWATSGSCMHNICSVEKPSKLCLQADLYCSGCSHSTPTRTSVPPKAWQQNPLTRGLL